MEEEFTFNLRIPGWSRGNPVPGNLYQHTSTENVPDWTATVNSEEIQLSRFSQGYLPVRRQWKRGDVLKLHLPMPVRQVRSHPAVGANEGKVALMRGPLIYCLEGVDHDEDVFDLSVPKDPDFEVEHREDLLGGVSVVSGMALADSDKPVDMTAIPYYAWDNREAGKMRVWIPTETS